MQRVCAVCACAKLHTHNNMIGPQTRLLLFSTSVDGELTPKTTYAVEKCLEINVECMLKAWIKHVHVQRAWSYSPK